MTTTAKTPTTEFAKALDRLRKDNIKANAAAVKLAADEQAKANAYQRQADVLSAEITKIDDAWAAGDETPGAADRARVAAEKSKAQALANGRTAAATRAKAQQVNTDDAAAQVVARAISAVIENAYPVHAIAAARGQDIPTPAKDETPCIVASQLEPAERQQDGSLSGGVGVMLYRPTWAAPIDWQEVERAARQAGDLLRVPDTIFDMPADPVNGIITDGHRVTVVKGSEALPLIPEVEHYDHEIILDAVQPILAHLEDGIDDLIYGVSVQVGNEKKLPKAGREVGAEIVFKRQVVEATRRMSPGVRERMQEEAEDRAHAMELIGAKPVGAIFRKSTGDEDRANFQTVAAECVGMLLPSIGVVSSVATEIIDVKQDNGPGYSRYVVNLRAVSRSA